MALDFVRLRWFIASDDASDYRAPTEATAHATSTRICRRAAIGGSTSRSTGIGPHGYCINGRKLEVHDLWHDAAGPRRGSWP